MPHTLQEMQREMERMGGEGFLFSIFPTETVRANMSASLVNASSAEVERLWTAYQKATIEQGLKPYSKEGGGAVAAPLFQSMEAETGYNRTVIAAWLNGLEKAVKSQGWDWRWLDPAAATAAGKPLTAMDTVKSALKETGAAAGNFLRPTLDPVTNLVKYASVGLVAAAVIYGLYHGTKLFKGRKRRKG